MSLTTLDTLLDKYNQKFIAAVEEITAWNSLSPTSGNSIDTKVGLFGADLTEIKEDCATISNLCLVADDGTYNEICDEIKDACNYVDSETFTGWAVGVCWIVDPASLPEAGQIDGVAFTESKWTVQIGWPADVFTDPVDVRSAIADVPISWDAPTNIDVDLLVANNAFVRWSIIQLPDGKADQFGVLFFKEDDEFYFETKDVTSMWTTLGAVAGVSGNVETAEFQLLGAVTLSAVAGFVVATLYF